MPLQYAAYWFSAAAFSPGGLFGLKWKTIQEKKTERKVPDSLPVRALEQGIELSLWICFVIAEDHLNWAQANSFNDSGVIVRMAKFLYLC